MLWEPLFNRQLALLLPQLHCKGFLCSRRRGNSLQIILVTGVAHVRLQSS